MGTLQSNGRSPIKHGRFSITQARMMEADSLKALDAAVESWNSGRGEWALATPTHRIGKVEELVKELKIVREQVPSNYTNVLQYHSTLLYCATLLYCTTLLY